ncbi:MAG: tryptophan--tRNA ligase [Aigarchaeota archaeon]|nr:tryptophan--tRNA ligase [Aigarchaeota archaeon]
MSALTGETPRKEEMVVTPWEVRGEIDYDRLIQEFGTEKITDELLARIKKHAGELHYMLRRKIFFSHRDLNWLLEEYEAGNGFHLYTGRGPSGHTHLGHLVPWIFTKWLQDKFDAKLYFQMTDDEKFLFMPELSLEQANSFAYENALDVIALGFDPAKTFIFSDLDYAKTLYRQALKVAKKLTFSTVKAVFGFQADNNVGEIFFTSVQSVPAFIESVKQGRNVPCLIPHAIDQDAHFRVARDVLPKLGYYKPAAIHCRFIPGLAEGGKMSASEPSSSIFTVDKPDVATAKIMNAFTGGRGNVGDQRRHGGNPDICNVFSYFYFIMEPNDEALKKRYEECKGGRLLCGECKAALAERTAEFLTEHQARREKARGELERFTLKD